MSKSFEGPAIEGGEDESVVEAKESRLESPCSGLQMMVSRIKPKQL